MTSCQRARLPGNMHPLTASSMVSVYMGVARVT